MFLPTNGFHNVFSSILFWQAVKRAVMSQNLLDRPKKAILPFWASCAILSHVTRAQIICRISPFPPSLIWSSKYFNVHDAKNPLERKRLYAFVFLLFSFPYLTTSNFPFDWERMSWQCTSCSPFPLCLSLSFFSRRLDCVMANDLNIKPICVVFSLRRL